MSAAPTAGPTGSLDVLVVGSANRDYVCTVPRLPSPGQTVLSDDLRYGTGGKGANQAVAAARFGARTAFVGRVGADDDGHAVLADLRAAGVEVSGVRQLPSTRTGTAFVTVAVDGENAIIVAAGANAALTAEDATSAVRDRARSGTVLVLQGEVPVAVVVAAAEAAAAAGARVVLNLAPFTLVPDRVLSLADPLVVNEGEAGELMGGAVSGVDGARTALAALRGRVRSGVVTLGAAGAVLDDGSRCEHVPAPPVDVVDTTGAGDAFTGALAARLAAGDGLAAAVTAGVAAGSYAVGRPGAQASYPTAEVLPTRSASGAAG